jgi:hypothetical protein
MERVDEEGQIATAMTFARLINNIPLRFKLLPLTVAVLEDLVDWLYSTFMPYKAGNDISF